MLLMLPATLCLAALVVHSLFFRSLQATKLFFCIALPASALYGGRDFYVFDAKIPHILGFPVIHVIGFTFAFYCAFSLSVHLCEQHQDGRRVVPFFRLLCATVFLTSFVGIAIEYVNFEVGWWTWKVKTSWLQIWGAWAWRPFMAFPLFLQFFVPQPAGSKKGLKLAIGWIVFALLLFNLIDIPPFSRVLQQVIFYVWFALLLSARLRKPLVLLDELDYPAPRPFPRTARAVDVAVAPGG